eukprot:m.191410 g.191410  ORF g.191410 m.191410 type:complete len:340 (-) comp24919_c0_seq1:471-1490(-)
MRFRPPGPDYRGAAGAAEAVEDPYETEYSRQFSGGGGQRPTYAVAASDTPQRHASQGRAEHGRAGAAPSASAAVVSRSLSIDDDNKRKARRERSVAAAAASCGGAAAADAHNSDDEMGGGGVDDQDRGDREFADDATFVAALERATGWKVKAMATDGACLFRSVAFHLFSDAEMHGTVREQCMNYMVQNRDHFEEFVTEDFDEYIARKRQARCFGNHLEMQAMSELYNRNIEVYSYSLQPINIFQAATNTNEPIRLSYHGNIHYNAIFNPSRPAFGVGLGFAGLQPGAADRHQVEQAQAASEQELLERELLASSMLQSEEEDMQAEIMRQVMMDSLYQR